MNPGTPVWAMGALPNAYFTLKLRVPRGQGGLTERTRPLPGRITHRVFAVGTCRWLLPLPLCQQCRSDLSAHQPRVSSHTQQGHGSHRIATLHRPRRVARGDPVEKACRATALGENLRPGTSGMSLVPASAATERSPARLLGGCRELPQPGSPDALRYDPDLKSPRHSLSTHLLYRHGRAATMCMRP